ncbi:MAG: ABC-F family ATP-binding cassette domain-containing protein [bacterium]|nr:ABC-F family ATP-binding cassette domain-containing protein [bacterium]
MANNDVILRFQEVSFEYNPNKKTLIDASASIRTGSKIALMGQNGAGKTTLFKLVSGELVPKEGKIFITPPDASIGIARQVMDAKYKDMTVREYFATAFIGEAFHLEKRIKEVLDAVNLQVAFDTKKVKDLSGGQQARLLLAHALIPNPDILLLDEPTNNLDQDGINHLTGFLIMYDKTCLVISHDAEFLNCFTDGVLYLDAHTKKIEQYTGNYTEVVEEIALRIEREKLQNARAETEIRKKKEQAEVFAHKGGKLRSVAKRMREAADDATESMVEVRREDKAIRPFTIPTQEFSAFFDGKVLTIDQIEIIEQGEKVVKDVDMTLRKGKHLLIEGPNGIGKSTLIDAIARSKAEGVTIGEGVRVGYYSQDFSTLDYDQTAYRCLEEVMDLKDEQVLRSTASGFLLDGKVLANEIGGLSEGQKGLLQFARLVLMAPGLLILDEPTNHINFRHIPVIAKALDEYKGAMVLVSHVPDFVGQVRIDEKIDLKAI